MAVEEHERRRPLLVAALGFSLVELRPEPAALTALKSWLNSWRRQLGRATITEMTRACRNTGITA
jgi:hypothetical protein